MPAFFSFSRLGLRLLARVILACCLFILLLAALIVGVPESFWQQAGPTMANGLLLLLAVALFFSLALSFCVRQLVVRRLAMLAEQVSRFRPDAEPPVMSAPLPAVPVRSDEIDQLAMAFDRMQRRISDEHRNSQRLQDQLSQQAENDSLTRLGNRNLLSQRARKHLAQADNATELAFVFIDIDRLKLTNDSLGHGVGDQLLCSVARRMQAVLPVRAELFRPGSDEFLILIPDSSAQPCVEQVVIDLQAVMAASFAIEHHEIPITVSIGICTAPHHGSELSLLLRNADIALQAAKQSGRGNACFFTPAMLENLNEQVRLESQLRQAIEREEFEIDYQPQIELGSGRLLGAEALLRWQHPQEGIISPSRFIPIAEDSGQIIAIGAWVLAAACREARRWQDLGLTDLTLSVNLSVIQLRHAGLIKILRNALAEARFPGECLEIEVTESALMDDVNQAATHLEAMRALGIGVAIDDFGTGYSSLAYLKHLPIDRLKIDRAFITDIPQDGNDTAIAIAIIRLAEALGLSVIAEGVENQAQAELLLSQGCHAGQGEYFSHPLPADKFIAYALANRSIKPLQTESS